MTVMDVMEDRITGHTIHSKDKLVFMPTGIPVIQEETDRYIKGTIIIVASIRGHL